MPSNIFFVESFAAVFTARQKYWVMSLSIAGSGSWRTQIALSLQ